MQAPSKVHTLNSNKSLSSHVKWDKYLPPPFQVPRFEWFYVDVESVAAKIGSSAETMKKFFNHKDAKHVITENNRNYLVMYLPTFCWA